MLESVKIYNLPISLAAPFDRLQLAPIILTESQVKEALACRAKNDASFMTPQKILQDTDEYPQKAETHP